MDRYLFIGAHPDDIEFGAGATLSKALGLNIECDALILSDCHESLEKSITDPNTLVYESQKALGVLGLRSENICFLNFPVRHFPKVRQEILQSLVERSRLREYSRVYVPASFDIHQDHHVVSIESLRAFKFSTILGYELPWNSFDGELRYFNSLDIHHVQSKKSALREFRSQSKKFYSSDKNIEVTLRFRGFQINTEYAESFEILRWIEN